MVPHRRHFAIVGIAIAGSATTASLSIAVIVAQQEADQAVEELLLLARRCAAEGKDTCLHCLLHSGLPIVDAVTPGGLPNYPVRFNHSRETAILTPARDKAYIFII